MGSTESTKQVRPFAAVLRELEKGKTHQDLSEYLQEVTEAVIETGKNGSVTLKITVKADADGDSVTVVDAVTKVVPEHDRKTTRFFVDVDNNLTRDLPTKAAPVLQGLSGVVDATQKAANQ